MSSRKKLTLGTRMHTEDAPKRCYASRDTLYSRVIQSFRDTGTRDLFHRSDSKAARKTCPRRIWSVARRKLDQLNQAHILNDLRAPPGNRLEPLRGDREGQHSIRINDQYRVCFRWTERGPADVEVTDYH